MRSKVPLKSIYAFVAVAETGSMTRAADQLSVSHSAISQSVKSLENQLSVPLFVRTGRCVELSAQGKKYYQKVAPALEQIIAASEELQNPENPNRLTLNMVASQAIHWWIPRVQGLQELAPELDIRISTITGPFDMQREGVDVAVVHGITDEWEDYYCDKLGDDELVMVCHPDILTPDDTPESLLKKYPAIHAINDRRKHDWRVWCKNQGLKVPSKRNILNFTSSLQGVQAAKRKLGIFVTHRLFVKDDIDNSLLTEVGSSVLNPHQQFYFACQPEKLKLESVQALRAWLRKEFEKE
ncbi:LysR substrate-binding domain-containing protein [Vibrio sp. JC009]|uniref:LysR substrate-binding domain-containing protein n=1 Tax=Vibrio sp. JC009 TaxID=2912314 RepID=UPI0023AFBF70|nr:LysR substrate-binding domain-containing protein [Vibrio sp. JC009]WED24180.1 LysR substrate-binding domain-containing protein [Vibrio sp. JC009]